MTTRVGAATGSNTATMPAHAVGDLIIAFAFRDGSTTAPTIPAGWTPLAPSNAAVAQPGTTCSAVLVAKRATTISETVGTFTNATFVGVAVYRAASGKKIGLGTWNFGAGTATSVTYPGTTLVGISSTSWVAAFAGHRSVDTNLQTAPTGMTAVSGANYVDATNEGAIHDTNGTAASWAGGSVAVGGTASGWIAAVVELREYTHELARWVAARDHPTDNVLVPVVGHSLPAGAGAAVAGSMGGNAIAYSYPQQLADSFTACKAVSSNASFMGEQNVTAKGYSPADYNHALTLNGWSAYAPVSTLGAKALTPAAASTLAIDFTEPFDRLRIFYPRVNGVPEYTVNVDGGASLGTLNMNDTTQSFASETFSVADGVHQIRIVAGATGGLIAGALTWRSTEKQVTFLNCSSAGALVTDFLDASTVWSPFNAIQTLGTVGATIVHLDANEILTGVGLEVFRYNLASFSLMRLFYGDVVLVSSAMVDPAITAEATQTTFHDAIASWADLLGCAPVRATDQPGLSTNAAGVALGYYDPDKIHMNAAGYAVAYTTPLRKLMDVSAVSASASITEAGDTASAAGAVKIAAAAAATEAEDTAAGVGALPIAGAGSPAEAGDTAAATGALPIAAAAPVSEADDTSSAAGAVPIQGAAAITEAEDTISASSSDRRSGAADVAEASDTAAGAGALAIKATAAPNEAVDTVAAAATVAQPSGSPVVGSAGIQEAGDAVIAAAGAPNASQRADALAVNVKALVQDLRSLANLDDRSPTQEAARAAYAAKATALLSEGLDARVNAGVTRMKTALERLGV